MLSPKSFCIILAIILFATAIIGAVTGVAQKNASDVKSLINCFAYPEGVASVKQDLDLCRFVWDSLTICNPLYVHIDDFFDQLVPDDVYARPHTDANYYVANFVYDSESHKYDVDVDFYEESSYYLPEPNGGDSSTLIQEDVYTFNDFDMATAYAMSGCSQVTISLHRLRSISSQPIPQIDLTLIDL